MRHLETEETEVDSVVSGVSGDTEQPMMIRCDTLYNILFRIIYVFTIPACSHKKQLVTNISFFSDLIGS